MYRILKPIGWWALSLGWATNLVAQAGTEVVLVPLSRVGEDLRVGSHAQRVTVRRGYDNQPAFSPSGDTLFFTRIESDGQADIFRFLLGTGTIERVTRTNESEYSPQTMPDGVGISVVRVERDSTQRLWRTGQSPDQDQALLPALAPVGYYVWMADGRILSFVLGRPTTLHVSNPQTGQDRVIANDVGRSLHRIPRSTAMSFSERVGGVWLVRAWDPDTGSRTIAESLPESQDHAWSPNGDLLMARSDTVFSWRSANSRWTPIGVVHVPGLQGITRLAVSPTGKTLAVVLNEEEQ